MSQKIIPFDFVLEELEELQPTIKPMFGAHGVYVKGKIVFILRDRTTSPADNGIWIATIGEHHASLAVDLPPMRSIEMFGPGPTGWQILPKDSDQFEELAFRLCELIKKQDPRIGKTPKTKLRAHKKSKTPSLDTTKPRRRTPSTPPRRIRKATKSRY